MKCNMFSLIIQLVIFLCNCDPIKCGDSYKLFATKMNFLDADSVCKNDSRRLASIKSSAEMDALKIYLEGLGESLDDMFIGLVWNSTNHQHKWLDDETLSWADWADQEPNCMSGPPEYYCTSSQDCVRIITNFQLRTADCTTNYYALCGPVIVPTTKTILTTALQTASPLTTALQTLPPETTELPTTAPETTPLPTTLPETTIFPTTEATALPTIPPEIPATTKPSTNATTRELSTPTRNTKNGDDTYAQTGLDCMCTANKYCTKWDWLINLNLTFDVLQAIVLDDFEKNIKPKISVDIDLLSRTIRRKTSAPDDRISSASIGWFSVALIVLPICIIVSVDCINICHRKKRRDVNPNC